MDFVCHETRCEFETNWSNNCSSDGNKNASYETCTSVPIEQTLDPRMPESVTSGLLPWQDLGADTVHPDLYQRYTLDLRFVPEQYRAMVVELQRLGYTDTDMLTELARLNKTGCSGAEERLESLSGYGGMSGKGDDVFPGATRDVDFSSSPSTAISTHISDWEKGDGQNINNMIQTELSQLHENDKQGLNIDDATDGNIMPQQDSCPTYSKGRYSWNIIRNGLIVIGCVTTGLFFFKKFY